MRKIRSKAIVLAVDGMDGSGKTTLIRYLKNRLESLHTEPLWQLPRAIKVYSEHVFKSSKEGLHFYRLMEAGQINDTDIALGAMYHSNAHLKHISETIANEYDVVLIDRFRPSFLAYQIHASGLDCLQETFEKILEEERVQGITPDYLYLRSSLERSKRLLADRTEQKSYHDGKDDRFKEKLLRGYDEFFYSTRYNFASNTIRVDLDQLEKETGPGLDVFLQEVFHRFMYTYSDLVKTVKEKHWDETKPKLQPGLIIEMNEEEKQNKRKKKSISTNEAYIDAA